MTDRDALREALREALDFIDRRSTPVPNVLVRARWAAALAQPAEPRLTEAWAEAEAALPEGVHICDVTHDREGWTVVAWPADHTDVFASIAPFPTPADALNALAAKLEAER